jgi:hypothetical protein
LVILKFDPFQEFETVESAVSRTEPGEPYLVFKFGSFIIVNAGLPDWVDPKFRYLSQGIIPMGLVLTEM